MQSSKESPASDVVEEEVFVVFVLLTVKPLQLKSEVQMLQHPPSGVTSDVAGNESGTTSIDLSRSPVKAMLVCSYWGHDGRSSLVHPDFEMLVPVSRYTSTYAGSV